MSFFTLVITSNTSLEVRSSPFEFNLAFLAVIFFVPRQGGYTFSPCVKYFYLLLVLGYYCHCYYSPSSSLYFSSVFINTMTSCKLNLFKAFIICSKPLVIFTVTRVSISIFFTSSFNKALFSVGRRFILVLLTSGSFLFPFCLNCCHILSDSGIVSSCCR